MLFVVIAVPPCPETCTLSLHDALPISSRRSRTTWPPPASSSSTTTSSARPTPTSRPTPRCARSTASSTRSSRSEEHTSELQSLTNLVCRLLLEKKNRHTDEATYDGVGS